MLFTSWRAGGLDQELFGASDYGTVAILHPSHPPFFPPETPINVRTYAELAPVARVANNQGVVDGEGTADLQVDIADMRLELSANDVPVAELMASIRLLLELRPDEDGALVPIPIEDGIIAEVYLIGEPLVDFDNDSILETVVLSQLRSVASSLLDGTSFALPSLDGAIVPLSVKPHFEGEWQWVEELQTGHPTQASCGSQSD